MILLNENILIGHIAEENTLHTVSIESDEALVIFSGEDAYISPNWYPTKQIHHKHVPTWNYQVVHIYGKITFQRDTKSKMAVIGRLTKLYEGQTNGSNAWKIGDAPSDFIEEMLDHIVAFKITISKVFGKSKLSQNRDIEDYNNVANILETNGKHELYRSMKIKKI